MKERYKQRKSDNGTGNLTSLVGSICASHVSWCTTRKKVVIQRPIRWCTTSLPCGGWSAINKPVLFLTQLHWCVILILCCSLQCAWRTRKSEVSRHMCRTGVINAPSSSRTYPRHVVRILDKKEARRKNPVQKFLSHTKHAAIERLLLVFLLLLVWLVNFSLSRWFLAQAK